MNHIESISTFENHISSRAAADLVGIHYKTLERMALPTITTAVGSAI